MSELMGKSFQDCYMVSSWMAEHHDWQANLTMLGIVTSLCRQLGSVPRVRGYTLPAGFRSGEGVGPRHGT
jgi:hypothetical protein